MLEFLAALVAIPFAVLAGIGLVTIIIAAVVAILAIVEQIFRAIGLLVSFIKRK